MVERIISFQFAGDGTERFHHNELSKTPSVLSDISLSMGRTIRMVSLPVEGKGWGEGLIVATRGNNLSAPLVGLRIANQNHREHINILEVELGEGRDGHFLLRSSCLSDIAYRSAP